MPASPALLRSAPSAAPAAQQKGAYAVIRNEAGQVLTVEANGRLYLPGGRLEPGETPRQALIREIGEECGWSAAVGAPLVAVEQPIMAGAVTLRASYWRARLTRELSHAAEHPVHWLDPLSALARLHRDGDRRALNADQATG